MMEARIQREACDVKINREWEQNTNCDILPTLSLTFPQATQSEGRGFYVRAGEASLGRGLGEGRSCGVQTCSDLGLACQLFRSAETEVERFPVTSTPCHPNYSNKN